MSLRGLAVRLMGAVSLRGLACDVWKTCVVWVTQVKTSKVEYS